MKKLFFMILSVILIALSAGCSGPTATNKDKNSSLSDSSKAESTIDPYYKDFEAYLLPGYPESEVPLFKSLAIDLCQFAVRNDPQWVASEGGLRNFYHVLYYSDSTRNDVLDFYKDLMDTVDNEKTFEDQVEGMIGALKVFVVAHADSKHVTVYVTVDLPKESLVEVNPFFSDYPADLIEVEPVFSIYDHRYEVNSSGTGRILYSTYYEMPVVQKEFYDYYRERYEDKESFNISDDGHITWKDGQYSIFLSYMKDFKRSTFAVYKSLD